MLERIRAAVGYAAIERQPEGFHLVGETDVFDQMVPYTLLVAPDGRFAEQVGGDLPSGRGFDGRICWQSDWYGQSAELRGQAREAALLTAWIQSHGWLGGPGASAVEVTWLGADESAARLGVKLNRGSWQGVLTVDAKTALPLELASAAEGAAQRWRFEQYEKALDGAFARRIQYMVGSAVRRDVRIHSVSAAPSFFADPYAMPASRPAWAEFDASIGANVEAAKAKTGHLLVRAKVGDGDAGWFVLDTNAGTSAITEAVAQAGGLHAVAATSVKHGGRTITSHVYRCPALRLGPARIDDLFVASIDLTALSYVAGKKLAGVIGYDVLSRLTLEIDLLQDRVAAHDPRSYSLSQGAWHPLAFDGKHACVEARFPGDATGWFRIDTTSPATVVFEPWALQRFALDPGDQGRTTRITGGPVVRRGVEALLDWFELADHRFRGIQAIFIQAPGVANVNPATGEPVESSAEAMLPDEFAAGAVGREVLKVYLVVLDYPNQRVGLSCRIPSTP